MFKLSSVIPVGQSTICEIYFVLHYRRDAISITVRKGLKLQVNVIRYSLTYFQMSPSIIVTSL